MPVGSEAARHFAAFMRSLGHDPAADPHLLGTPERVARMYADLLGGGDGFPFTTFPADGADQMIVVRDIPFASFCAHHFLPFTGVAHVAYVPGERIAGLSKLARAVVACAARPQVQERLTDDIARLLTDRLDALGVAVVVEARHDCMQVRGVRAVGATTVTSALNGCFRDRPEARAELFAILNRKAAE